MYRCSPSNNSVSVASLIALAKARIAACLPILWGQPSYQSANPSGSPPKGGLWGDSFLGKGKGKGIGAEGWWLWLWVNPAEFSTVLSMPCIRAGLPPFLPFSTAKSLAFSSRTMRRL
jgi:hypothetical protein